MLTIKPAQLNFDSQGLPFSKQYNDYYFSQAGPVEESQFVFIQGNRLEERWKDNNFTIAELGFGFGINFTSVGNAWIKTDNKNNRLDYISIEKHPIKKSDLIQLYKYLNINTEISSELLNQYPLPLKGFHRINFDEQNISLTLIFDHAINALNESIFEADAWFLDGFSPSKNQDLWSLEVAQEISRLSRINTTFATYSAASYVRENFTQAGFSVEKKQGFNKKREMLVGLLKVKENKHEFHYKDKSWFNSPAYTVKNKHAIIVGGGLAGFSIASALARRGWYIKIIDKNDHPASEGSGNKNAILMPRLSVDYDHQSQLTLEGFYYSINFLNHLKRHNKHLTWEQCGAIQIPRDKTQQLRMQQIISQEIIPADLIHTINKQEAKEISGCDISNSGWHIPQAGWTIPNQICNTLYELHKDQIEFISNTEINSICKDNKGWATRMNDQLIAKAEIVVIANANASSSFAQTHWCKTYPKRGQVTYILSNESNIHPKKIICSDAYITPMIEDQYVLGATFITDDANTDVREHEHQENFEKIKKTVPTLAWENIKTVEGRAAVRAVSSDRLPIVGPVADDKQFYKQFENAALGGTNQRYSNPSYHSGLYVATGFGSRGLAWIPLCSDLLACLINNEPKPIGLSLSNAIHPNRLLMKNLIKKANA
ncbi:MAG: bifunctional tRNA (5-methylaminomethyl-2-thiouridine)(34)-methyltransferase MnmD/FAD-dependent 5-carboxymethylaminomethyl-2-thiouridine(34) oxidoreductase MnmC [Pseudomonadota bacterium]